MLTLMDGRGIIDAVARKCVRLGLLDAASLVDCFGRWARKSVNLGYGKVIVGIGGTGSERG